MDSINRLITIPLLDAAAQKFLDQSFIEETGLPGLVLMEQAAEGITQLVKELVPPGSSILCLAGAGNNGGDAWASARQLMAQGYIVTVMEIFPEKSLPADARCNKQAYIRLGGRVIGLGEEVSSYAVYVDGIIGTGFRIDRPLADEMVQLIKSINLRDGYRIAIDIPTGIESDTGACDRTVFLADHTITFGAQKIGLMAEPGKAYAGHIRLVPISFLSDWLERQLLEYQTKYNRCLLRGISIDSFKQLDLRRSPLSHKGSYGKALLVGGSPGMSGSMLLALRAAQATGVGYAYVRAPGEIVPELLQASPESLIDSLPRTEEVWNKLVSQVDSVLLGPGAGRADWLDQAFPVLSQAKRLIIDADGLNFLAEYPEGKALLRIRMEQGLSPAVLTPHPGEYKRLAPKLAELLARDRQAAAAELAKEYSSVVVLKGHASVIALPSGECFINTSGNAALARAGSGDVLSGLLAGFLARDIDLSVAVSLSVFIHGLLADIATGTLGSHGVTPSSLLDFMPQAFDRLDQGIIL